MQIQNNVLLTQKPNLLRKYKIECIKKIIIKSVSSDTVNLNKKQTTNQRVMIN